MSTGEALYLLLVIVSLTVFALGLAYYSWQHTQFTQRRAAPSRRAAAQPGALHA